MKQFLKSAAYAGFVIPLLAALLSPQAVAGEKRLGEGEGIVTQIGAHASAVTYWVAGPEGWDVVTTVDPLAGKEDDNDGGAVMRFSSRLLPGQSQTISVPAAVGGENPSLVIRRVADRIEVEAAPAWPD